ncbi:cupin domain-containing protein [Candidatus Pacearchaeota archaeon]|nr:cupin domain-containing protein [Candidatus Pacearchaeota archaeon]
MARKINKYKIRALVDACGLIRELYKSQNISIATVSVSGEARKHKHNLMEEVYYIEKGEGQVVIDNEIIELEEGDLISIPKEKWHYLRGNLEVLVINFPPYDISDVIYSEPD